MKLTLAHFEHRLRQPITDSEREDLIQQARGLVASRVRRQPVGVRTMIDLAMQHLVTDDLRRMDLLMEFGSLFFQSDRHQDANDLFLRAYQIAETLGDNEAGKTCLSNLASTDRTTGNYGKSLKYYRMLQERQLRDSNREGVGWALTDIGTVYWHLGEFSRSLEYQQEALRIGEELNNPRLLEIALNNIGLVYYKMGSLEESLEHHLHSLALKQKRGNHRGAAASLTNIGIIYRHMESTLQALDAHRQALAIYEELKSPRGIAQCFVNIGLVYEDLGDFEKCLEYFHSALKMKQNLRDPFGIILCLSNIGEVYLETGSPIQALEYLRKALGLAEETWDKWQVAWISSLLSAGLISTGDFEQACIFIDQGLKIAVELGSKELMRELYKVKSDYHAAKEEFADALSFHKKSSDLRYSIAEDQNKQRVVELQKRREAERQDHEAKMSEALEMIDQLRREKLEMGGPETHDLQVKLGETMDLVRRQQRELSRAYDRLEQLVRFDPMTNLGNRRAFHERVMMEKDRSERTGKPFAIIIADVDDFTHLNDRFGHDVGDYVMSTAAQIFRSAVRKQDFIARWGGGKFILLLPETRMENGLMVSEKLREVVQARKYLCKGMAIPVSMTFGVSAHEGGASVAECLRQADASLQAKKDMRKQKA
jgi:diguanylate cyclase (GGDEF)-like protein